MGFFGVGVIIVLSLAMSSHRGKVPWKLVLIGVVLDFVIGALILKTPGIADAFGACGKFVNGLIERSKDGIEFVFGSKLNDMQGPWGFIFAVKVLPIIIFFSALMSVLYYVGLMQRLVAALAWVMRRTMGVTGSEAMCMAAGIFLGQTEAPLTIRPLIQGMTRAQLMTVMLGGFANTAGSVLGAYVMMLGGSDKALRAELTTHLLASSVLSAPAAFVVARIILPETETPPAEDVKSLESAAPIEGDEAPTNFFDAAAAGATDGVKLAINVAAMLIAFVSLLAVVNWGLQGIGHVPLIAHWRSEHGVPDFSIQLVLGYLFAPLAWSMGVPWSEAGMVGTLLGEKLVITELLAYDHLGHLMHPAALADGTVPAAAISHRSATIAAYALCGFSNFASIAIQIGGLSVLAPNRRKDFAQLALKAMLGGALATQMTACVASVFI